MAMLSVEWAPLALRLVLGAIFIIHGYPKLKNFKGTADWLAGIGFKPGAFWAFALGSAEFFGGIAILIGLFSRIGAGLLIVSMLVATYFNIFKWKKKFSGGYEFDLMILAGLIAIFLLGAGSLSIDQAIGWMLG